MGYILDIVACRYWDVFMCIFQYIVNFITNANTANTYIQIDFNVFQVYFTIIQLLCHVNANCEQVPVSNYRNL